MKAYFELFTKLNWLYNSVYFFRQYFKVIFLLGLIAGFGRVIQLGAFGQISSLMSIFLEVIIESSRVIIFIYVLGLANIKSGLLRIKRFINNRSNRQLNWAIAIQKLKMQWLSILLNLIVFSVIAFAINYLIDILAYETCLYITLRRDGLIAETASEWIIILFFKNLSVIPFTLTFYAIFLLWITNNYRYLGHNKR